MGRFMTWLKDQLFGPTQPHPEREPLKLQLPDRSQHEQLRELRERIERNEDDLRRVLDPDQPPRQT
jgi:hypothetical protein